MPVVNEIFRSIQGESTFVGRPCTFVRLAGCNLRCSYCDTVYAQEKDSGKEALISEIMDEVAILKCPLVEVTGGEPLLQEDTRPLLDELILRGYEVLLETNGSQSISGVNPLVRIIMDIKCPSSGHVAQMCWENLGLIVATDEIKFVIMDETDYKWAKDITTHQLEDFKGTILMSPIFESGIEQNLAKWILRDGLDVRMQLQLHKCIWPSTMRGV